jgi:DNA-binding transcriptional regulator YdaS (Cro superfamily)
MNLHEYLAKPGSLTVAELRERIGVKSDAQIRQWQHGYADRRPGPEYCVAIEQATEGAVTRRDLRPDDWLAIWPELERRTTPRTATAKG